MIINLNLRWVRQRGPATGVRRRRQCRWLGRLSARLHQTIVSPMPKPGL